MAQLTKGNWEVVDFYGFHEKSKRIFFSAAVNGATERGIYSVNYGKPLKSYAKNKKAIIPDGDNSKKLNTLVDNGHMNDADFSSSFDYFINFESGPELPYQIVLFDDNGKQVRDLELNQDLKGTNPKFANPIWD